MPKGFISDEDVAKVREATDLVALVGERTLVRQRGRDFWCCCPFHNEKTPSMKMDAAAQLWHCFGCGEGGDVFSFVMKADDMTFAEAVRHLAERAHIEIAEADGTGVSSGRKQRLREVCAAAAEFYHGQLMRGASDGAARAREYLATRGFGGSVPKRWDLGFAPGGNALVHHLSSRGFTADEMMDANVAVRSKATGRTTDRFFDRVMFPIHDAQGTCIAFGGRVIGDGNPKYLNSQETPLFHKSKVLYGLDKAKAQMTATGTAVVVEGYTDVIALHEAGVGNAVATLGTALTMQHIRMLSRHAGKRIVYLFDGDAAGQRAADRALQFIDYAMTPEAGKNKMEICAVTLPDELDPAEFVAARGGAELNLLLQEAKPLLVFGIERRVASHDLSTAEGRSAALVDALSVLAPIKDSILAKDYAVQIAGMVRVREEDALAQLAGMKAAKPTVDAEGGEAAPNRATRAGGRANLTQGERNRLRLEREFLGLAAQNPLAALEQADVLVKTRWHDRLHAQLAEGLLAALADDLNAGAAEVVAKVGETVPLAPKVLTAATTPEGSTPEHAIGFLARELQIGDGEDAVAALKSRLANPDALPPEENARLYGDLIALQRRLVELRRRQKPEG